MRQILVTGGCGVVGSHFANDMAEAGHAVTVLDDLSLGRREYLSAQVRFVYGEVQDRLALREAAGPGCNAIVHLAGSGRHVFTRGLRAAYENNVLGQIDVLKYAREIGARMIFASGSPDGGRISSLHNGDGSFQPADAYAASKLAQEEISAAFTEEHGLQVTAFRLAEVYGLNELHLGNFASVVSRLVWQARRGDKQPVVWGDAADRRDLVYVADVVRGLQLAVEAPTRDGGPYFRVYDLGTGQSRSLFETARLVGRATGLDLQPHFTPGPVPASCAQGTCADLVRVRRELGYEPRWSLEDGVADLLRAKEAPAT